MLFFNPGDYQQRIQICKDMLRRLEEKTVDQINNLWMDDETHIHLSEIMNNLDFRCKSNVNP